jgi:serine/threonine-protein kinase RsbW
MTLDTGANALLDHHYPSTLESVDLAESEILKAAGEIGFDEDEQHRIGMAVRECMVNAVVHGNRYNRKKHVHVRVVVEKANAEKANAEKTDAEKAGAEEVNAERSAPISCFTIRITDEGEGFEIQEVPDPLHDNNLLRHSGRGLFLMGAFMDDMKVRKVSPAGTEVTLVKIIGQQES